MFAVDAGAQVGKTALCKISGSEFKRFMSSLSVRGAVTSLGMEDWC